MRGKSQLRPLATNVAQKNKMGIREAENFVRLMFEVIQDGLQEDKFVKVKGLGGFKLTTVKDRESVDVNTGERIVIEGRDRVSFTPDSVMRDLVNKPFAQFDTVLLNEGVDFTEIDEKFEEQAEREEAELEAPVELIDFDDAEREISVDEPLSAEEAPASDEAPVDVPPVEEIPLEGNLAMVEEQPEISSESLEPSSQEVSTENQSMETPPATEETLTTETEVEAPAVEKTPAVEESLVVDEVQAEPFVIAEALATEEIPVVPEAHVEAETEPQTAKGSSKHLEQSALKDEAKQETVSIPLVDVPIQQAEAFRETEEDTSSVMEEEMKESRSVLKYIALIGSAFSFVLVICLGVLAYQYHKVVMQRNKLLMTVSLYENGKKVEPAQSQADNNVVREAKLDSARMQDAASAVVKAEQATRQEAQRKEENSPQSAGANKEQKTMAASTKSAKETVTPKKAAVKAVSSSQYDSDPRVRTGAYRIVGVAQTVKVKKGQTLSSISKAYLGPGMECYVEALNGVKEVKEGQSLKIPKLERKKKK